MATRLYFQSTDNIFVGSSNPWLPPLNNSGITPDASGSNAGNAFSRLDTPIGTIGTSDGTLSVAKSTAQNMRLRSFISPPLQRAFTIGGGSILLNTADSEANTSANFWVNSFNAYVWDTVNLVKRGTIRNAVGTSLGGSEPTAASSEQVTHITGITSSAVQALAGDRIVVEMWSAFTQSMSAQYNCTFYFGGTVVNTTENAVVSDHASFIEFSEDFDFNLPPIRTLGLLGVG